VPADCERREAEALAGARARRPPVSLATWRSHTAHQLRRGSGEECGLNESRRAQKAHFKMPPSRGTENPLATSHSRDMHRSRDEPTRSWMIGAEHPLRRQEHRQPLGHAESSMQVITLDPPLDSGFVQSIASR